MIASSIKFAAGLALAVSFTPAFSATLSQGNVIHFIGQVVEDPCVITPESHNLSVSCPRDNKMHTRRVSYSDALSHTPAFTDRATISMKYINPQKSLAIVQVDYR